MKEKTVETRDVEYTNCIFLLVSLFLNDGKNIKWGAHDTFFSH
jgi:hypothetical protein